MCRACTPEGPGRRCPQTQATRINGREAASRYYRRGKARLKIAQLADLGIPAVDDTAMPATYHAPRAGRPLDLTEEHPIVNARTTAPDKPEGALWTAPGRTEDNGAVKSAWTDYDADEGGSSQPSKELHVLRPTPGAVIVCINNEADAEALMARYNSVGAYGDKVLDWEAMAADGIDGVYVDGQAVKASFGKHGQAINGFYGWDVASVAWLSNKHLSTDESTVPGGEYKIEYSDDADGYGGYPMVIDPRHGEYVAPEHPDLAQAWDRVPKKLRPTPAGQEPAQEATAAPEATEGASGKSKTPRKPRKPSNGTSKTPATPKAPGSGSKGPAPSSDYDTIAGYLDGLKEVFEFAYTLEGSEGTNQG